MSERILKKGGFLLTALLIVAIVLAALWSCGTDSYDDPSASVTTTKTATALIEAATLKQWMDEGKVNGTGNDRVVILDVTSADQYNATNGKTDKHIPGAQLFNTSTEYVQTRLEGLAAAFGMVPDGEHMDSYVKRFGIDANTTIVFTTSSTSNVIMATRGYFTFRYWGFPKERLKVLNGYNKAWNAAYPDTLTTEVPTVKASTFSVRNNGTIAGSIRASLGEMIAVVKAASATNVIVDTRGSDGLPGSGTKYSYDGDAGTTPGVFLPGGDYVAFEGRMKGAKALGYTGLLDSTTGKFLSTDQLIAKLATIGIDSSKTAYVHCRTGVIASAQFFIMDGVLGWKAVLYDGSWSQWASMSGDASKDGVLDSYSGWRTDTAALSEVITYNKDNALVVEKPLLDGTSVQLYSNTADLTANQIENEDADYMASGSTSGSSTNTNTSSSSGGGC